MYSGLRVRFGTQFTLSCLSMHCQSPTKKNMSDLEHLLRYLNGTIKKEIKLAPTSMDIQVYADASFMLHSDRKGHTGCIVTLGLLGPCIGAKASKQGPRSPIVTMHPVCPFLSECSMNKMPWNMTITSVNAKRDVTMVTRSIFHWQTFGNVL